MMRPQNALRSLRVITATFMIAISVLVFVLLAVILMVVVKNSTTRMELQTAGMLTR